MTSGPRDGEETVSYIVYHVLKEQPATGKAAPVRRRGSMLIQKMEKPRISALRAASDSIGRERAAPGSEHQSAYWMYVSAFVTIASGFALIIEHLITWEGFDLRFGHEWIGLILIVLGMILGLNTRRWKK